MAGKGGDYEGWILRLIDKPEDLLKSYTVEDWLKFAAGKIEDFTGQGITKGQIGSLLEYRNQAFELPQELGFKLVEKTSYRDARGRWTKEVTDRPVTRIVYRGAGEKFISRAKVAGLISAEQSARGIRKKTEEQQ